MIQLNAVRFLVVDDFSTMRTIVRGLLREMGCTNVEEAEDGAIAFRRLQNDRSIGFIIADINMPNMTGLELLKNVREDAKLAAIPFLLVTAESKKEDIIKAAQLQASGYILKPFTYATFRGKLISIADRHSLGKA